MNSTDSRPLMVTIRCITYNHEPYIRQCLEGFVMQKTNFRFEAVVHDDASTDGTADIIREYAAKYPDIIKPIYETENQYSKRDGSLARIMDEACKGKYIALCEGDDYWIDPLKLQKQVNFMETHPGFTMCGSNGLIVWDMGENRPSYFNKIFSSKELLAQDIIGKWAMPTASLLYKKEIKSKYPEWSKEIYSGDQTLMLVALYRGRIFCLRDLTCIHRKSRFNTFSISNNTPALFVYSQHLKLYKCYNEWTKYKFNYIVEPCIKNLEYNFKQKKLYEKYLTLKRKSPLLPYINMPIYALKMLKGYLSLYLKNHI